MDVDKEARSTRSFWTEPLGAIDDNLAGLIQEYAMQAETLEELDIPGREAFKPIILNTGDGAPGVDGIPYSVYRLLPDQAAELLAYFLYALIHRLCTTRLPAPLLVWIPKATAGFLR